MKKIVISKMFIEPNGENVRLCSIIKSDKEDYKMWFEVEKKYEQYILKERADAFVAAVLPYAIKKGLDIFVEDNISARLSYQLNKFIIPMFCQKLKKKVITIEASTDNKRYNIANAVATGGSCGVDSLYTISQNINLKDQEFNLTHITYLNSGAFGDYGGEETRNLYKNRMQPIIEFSEANNFELVSIDSNISEFLMLNFHATHTMRSLACILALQKLFSKYYYSSAGYDFNETKIKLDEDIAYSDILILECFTTEDTIFYYTGMETGRMGKVKEIVKYEPSYNVLNVCLDNSVKNCGICQKCKRTMLELDSIGKLELYKNVFDIDYFYKHKNEYLIWMMKNKNKGMFISEIYDEYKKRNKNIPFKVKLLSIIPTKYEIRKKLEKIPPLKEIIRVIKKEPKPINKDDGWD